MRALKLTIAAAGMLIGFASCDKESTTPAEGTSAGTGTEQVSTPNFTGRYRIERFEMNGSSTDVLSSMTLKLGKEGKTELALDTVIDRGVWMYDETSGKMAITMSGTDRYGLLVQSQSWKVTFSDGQRLQMEAPEYGKKIMLLKANENSGSVNGSTVPGKK